MISLIGCHCVILLNLETAATEVYAGKCYVEGTTYYGHRNYIRISAPIGVAASDTHAMVSLKGPKAILSVDKQSGRSGLLATTPLPSRFLLFDSNENVLYTTMQHGLGRLNLAVASSDIELIAGRAREGNTAGQLATTMFHRPGDLIMLDAQTILIADCQNNQ